MMKYLISICALVVMCSFSAYAKNRVISGQFVYDKSKKPATGITLYYEFGNTYPSFLVFFIPPRQGNFNGKIITDNQGKFKLETKHKGLIIIQPILKNQKDDVTVGNLTDTMKAYSKAGSRNLIVRSAKYLTGDKDAFLYYMDGNKIYFKLE